jgi:hypothetical protein
MSRTDELRDSGARQVGGRGENAPFVKWGNEYVFVEGVIESFWSGEHGEVARLKVTQAHAELEGQLSKDEPRVAVEVGMVVNLGLGYAALSDIGPHLEGAEIHVAFTEWGETKGGNRFRNFTVFQLTDANESAPPAPAPGSRNTSSPPPSQPAGAGVTDDDIPF